MKGTGCAKKKLTKVVGSNFACVVGFLMKFRYVMDIDCKLFYKKIQVYISKNV